MISMIVIVSVYGEKEKDKERPPITAGTLIAEPHSWKSLAIGQPVLRIRTTANRYVCLLYPAESLPQY